MTPEKARMYLNMYLAPRFKYNAGLPMNDEVIISIASEDGKELREYTFRYLLKIAYGLKEDDRQESDAIRNGFVEITKEMAESMRPKDAYPYLF